MSELITNIIERAYYQVNHAPVLRPHTIYNNAFAGPDVALEDLDPWIGDYLAHRYCTSTSILEPAEYESLELSERV
jgi:hypothetical protein